jgi:hypothetical protein
MTKLICLFLHQLLALDHAYPANLDDTPADNYEGATAKKHGGHYDDDSKK